MVLCCCLDPMIDGGRRSDLMLGGLIGGTAAAVVAAVIIVVIVRLCSQWRRYQKAVQRALGEIQSNSPDGAAITPANARRDSFLLGTFLYKKLSYRRGTARCVMSVEILQLPGNSAETTCTTSHEPSITVAH